ncbi:MAG TPA: cbb3-type cytochrome oxidase assembly protein CcoS [Mucilaginibacter sp.]|jgi:cbb3-type cytochrome oxidase maturation protein|nr:cbb3-type cytochrome oxidase assembly protein CcoS [Mucilaginibacter sp.]
MSIIYFLIGCSLLLAICFLAAFFWAQRTGQNDDLHTPSMRILLDDDELENENPLEK